MFHLSSFDLDKIKRTVVKKQLELDFFRLTLVSNDKKHSIIGPGQITQDKTGKLKLKFFANSEFQQRNISTGDIVPDTEFYTLSGMDTSGTTWTASRVLPYYPESYSLHTPERVILADLFEIEHQSPEWSRPEPISTFFEEPHKYELPTEHIMVSAHEYNIPHNSSTVCTITHADGYSSKSTLLDHTVGQIDDWNFKFLQIEGHPEVYCSGYRLPPNVLTACREAISFALGKGVEWSYFCTQIGGNCKLVIRSPTRDLRNSRLCPPIQAISAPGEGTFFKLFQHYFSYSASLQKEDLCELSCLLLRAIESSCGSFQQHCNGIATAVEGTLRILLPDSPDRSTQLSTAVDNIKQHLKTCDLSHLGESEVAFRNRIDGLLGQLYQENAKSKMRGLKEKSFILNDDIGAWSDLRNPSAHGQILAVDIDNAIIFKVGRVTSLLYKLMFLIIRYQGAYTDYSQIGWPNQLWSHSLSSANDDIDIFNVS
ncbi:hypothetical protein [Lacunimicrobium album]